MVQVYLVKQDAFYGVPLCSAFFKMAGLIYVRIPESDKIAFMVLHKGFLKFYLNYIL